jgi:outer membrane protein assembly factor BamB
LITGREKWRQPIPCGLSSDSGLIIDNQNMLLLINRLDGYLYSYHLETGNLIWKFKGPDLGFMLSRKANNVISNCRFKISTLGFILSNKEDLKQKFFSIVDQLSFQESYFLSNVYSEPIIFQDKVIAGCANGYLYALNILSGSLIWKSKLCDSSLHIGLYPVLLDNQLFVFRESSMILFSINPENGKEIWKYSPASYHSYSKNPKLYRNPNTLSNESKFPEYIYLETACQIICLDRTNGKLIWSSSNNEYLTEICELPCLPENTLYALDFQERLPLSFIKTSSYITSIGESLITQDGEPIEFNKRKNHFYSLNTENGEFKEKMQLDSSICKPLVFEGSLIYYHQDIQSLISLDIKTQQENWRLLLEGNRDYRDSPIQDDNMLFLTQWDEDYNNVFLHIVDLSTGEEIKKIDLNMQTSVFGIFPVKEMVYVQGEYFVKAFKI